MAGLLEWRDLPAALFRVRCNWCRSGGASQTHRVTSSSGSLSRRHSVYPARRAYCFLSKICARHLLRARLRIPPDLLDGDTAELEPGSFLSALGANSELGRR